MPEGVKLDVLQIMPLKKVIELLCRCIRVHNRAVIFDKHIVIRCTFPSRTELEALFRLFNTQLPEQLRTVGRNSNIPLFSGLCEDGKPTIAELIWQTVSKLRQPVADAVRHSELGVDYIPSNFMLAGILSILGTDSDSTGVFSRLFSDSAFEAYDYIIIDCPPTLDLLVSNALKACDKVLIPVQSDYWAYEGVDQLLATLQRTKQTDDIKPYVLGMLITMFNKRTNSAKAIMDAMTDSYGEFVFDTAIAFRDEVKVATIEHKTLVGKKNSITGQQYMAVVDEIIGKEGQDNG